MAAPSHRPTPIMTPLEVTKITSVKRHSSGTISVVRVSISGAIAEQRTPGIAVCRSAPRVQVCDEIDRTWRPVTSEQAIDLAQLRQLSGPITVCRVMAHLGWSRARATRRLALFVARGLLDATPRGHVWRRVG